MKLVIIPRIDDGTFDLFEKLSNGRLDFLSNHESKEEAENEKESYGGPMSQEDSLRMIRQLKHSLQQSNL